MLLSIYCFCITRSQCTDKKGIQEETWNNSVQSVLEQKVKLQNTLYNCNRIGLEREAEPSPAQAAPQGALAPVHTDPRSADTGAQGPSGKPAPRPRLQRHWQIIGFLVPFFFLQKHLYFPMKHCNKGRTELYILYDTPGPKFWEP